MASSYADAAACLAKVEKGSRSLKSAAYESRDPKKTYALCAEALKVRASLRAAIVTVLGNNFSAQVEMCAAPSRRRRRASTPSPSSPMRSTRPRRASRRSSTR